MRWFVRFGLAAAVVSCGTQFDSIGQLDGVRVMGIRKSSPYVEPGEPVTLDLLYHDTGAEGGDEPRQLSFFWLSGCENPPGDSYAGCFQQFAEVFTSERFDLQQPEDVLALVERASELGVGFGVDDEYTFEVSDDVLSDREPEPGQIAYGLNYVFFAVCAGELRADQSANGFPLGCFDGQGKRLGARDFVAGYTSIYSYETLSNRNPQIRGVRVGGKRLDDRDICIDDACDPLPERQRACPSGMPRVSACADEDDWTTSCPALQVSVVVDEQSVDLDRSIAGEPVPEQMWVTYHADRGAFDNDLALISDRLAGFQPHPATNYLASERRGPVYLWAVVRDNRGGASWARFQVCVE